MHAIARHRTQFEARNEDSVSQSTKAVHDPVEWKESGFMNNSTAFLIPWAQGDTKSTRFASNSGLTHEKTISHKSPHYIPCPAIDWQKSSHSRAWDTIWLWKGERLCCTRHHGCLQFNWAKERRLYKRCYCLLSSLGSGRDENHLNYIRYPAMD